MKKIAATAILILLAFFAMSFINLGPFVAPTTAVSFTATGFTASGSEAMVTLTPIRNFVAGSTGTSFAVTSQSTLKLQSICIVTANAGAATQGVVVRVRINPTGAATTSSPVVFSIGTGTLNAATAAIANSSCAFLGEGLELSGTAQVGISQIGTATAGNDVTLIGYERQL